MQLSICPVVHFAQMLDEGCVNPLRRGCPENCGHVWGGLPRLQLRGLSELGSELLEVQESLSSVVPYAFQRESGESFEEIREGLRGLRRCKDEVGLVDGCAQVCLMETA